jgi:hypothetical protein
VVNGRHEVQQQCWVQLQRTAFLPPCAQVVFSEAWWVGTKAENPEEKELPMPRDLEQTKLHDEAECGFLGGSCRGCIAPQHDATLFCPARGCVEG